MYTPLPHDERKFVDEDLHREENLRREVYVRPKVAVVFNGAYSILRAVRGGRVC